MAARYGIAEWYGKDIRHMSGEERRYAAEVALSQRYDVDPVVPRCPFMQPLQPGAVCNKVGGVCSIRRFVSAQGVNAVSGEPPVTVCPTRLRERYEGADMFSTIGEILYDDPTPLVVKEVPFLQKRNVGQGQGKAGRIDWIVLPGDSATGPELRWAAVETQAIYFSGDNIWVDIEDYLANPATLRMPVGQRRPDYRSSGPKRLSPQLDVKAPRIGRWGMNTVVVVDEYFWSQMTPLDESKQIDPANDEVIWCVLRYDESMHLVFHKAVGASVAESRDALSGTDVMNKDEFTRGLMRLLTDRSSGKVYEIGS